MSHNECKLKKQQHIFAVLVTLVVLVHITYFISMYFLVLLLTI